MIRRTFNSRLFLAPRPLASGRSFSHPHEVQAKAAAELPPRLSDLLEVHRNIAREMEDVFEKAIAGPTPSREKGLLRWMDDVRDTGSGCHYQAAGVRKNLRKNRNLLVAGICSLGVLVGMICRDPLGFPLVLAAAGMVWKGFHDRETRQFLKVMGWGNIGVNTGEASRLGRVVKNLMGIFDGLKPPPFGDSNENVRTEYEARRLAIERVLGLLEWAGRTSTVETANLPIQIEWRRRILNLAEFVQNGVCERPSSDFLLFL